MINLAIMAFNLLPRAAARRRAHRARADARRCATARCRPARTSTSRRSGWCSWARCSSSSSSQGHRASVPAHARPRQRSPGDDHGCPSAPLDRRSRSSWRPPRSLARRRGGAPARRPGRPARGAAHRSRACASAGNHHLGAAASSKGGRPAHGRPVEAALARAAAAAARLPARRLRGDRRRSTATTATSTRRVRRGAAARRTTRARRVVEFEVTRARSRASRAVDLAGVRPIPRSELRRSLLAQPRRAYDPAFLQLDVLQDARRCTASAAIPCACVDTLVAPRRARRRARAVQLRRHEGPQSTASASIEYFERPARCANRSAGARCCCSPATSSASSRLDLSLERHVRRPGCSARCRCRRCSTRRRASVDLLIRVAARPARWIDVRRRQRHERPLPRLRRAVGPPQPRHARARRRAGRRAVVVRRRPAARRGAAATLTEPWLLRRAAARAGRRLLPRAARPATTAWHNLYTPARRQPRLHVHALPRAEPHLAADAGARRTRSCTSDYSIDCPARAIADDHDTGCEPDDHALPPTRCG